MPIYGNTRLKKSVNKKGNGDTKALQYITTNLRARLHIMLNTLLYSERKISASSLLYDKSTRTHICREYVIH